MEFLDLSSETSFLPNRMVFRVNVEDKQGSKELKRKLTLHKR